MAARIITDASEFGRACGESPWSMNGHGEMNGGMWGMGGIRLLVLMLVILGIAAALKYLRK